MGDPVREAGAESARCGRGDREVRGRTVRRLRPGWGERVTITSKSREPGEERTVKPSSDGEGSEARCLTEGRGSRLIDLKSVHAYLHILGEKNARFCRKFTPGISSELRPDWVGLMRSAKRCARPVETTSKVWIELSTTFESKVQRSLSVYYVCAVRVPESLRGRVRGFFFFVQCDETTYAHRT